MDTTASEEELETDNLIQRRGEIERLWLEGLTTHEIAAALGVNPRSVGQNLRALRNRRARAAARQQEVVAMTQCATIVREAMEAWERSKRPKVTTTVEEKDGQPVKTVTREVEGPGDKGFLLAALNALKTLRRFAPEKPPKTTEQVDKELVELLQILTPEQVDQFSHAQFTRCQQAVEAREASVAERRRVSMPEANQTQTMSQQLTCEANKNQFAKDLMRPVGKKREEAQIDLLTFTRQTKLNYLANWHHEVLAKKLDRVANGDCRRLMVFMPPQHGKSELVSRRFPAYMLGRDPNLRLIAASHTHELAVAMNRDVQRVIDSDAYSKLFNNTKLATPRSPRGQFLPRRTMGFFEIVNCQGGLRSAGVGQSIAGLPADGAIIDDPFGKREEADSATIRQKVWDWYANDLYTRLSANAWIVLTHTRWHRDDLAGRLLQKMAGRAADQWEILCLPAIKEQGAGSKEQDILLATPSSSLATPCSLLPAADLCQPGDPLWPAFKSAHDLEIIKQQDARAFAALYQQDPAQATLSDWPPELFGDTIWLPREQWPKDFTMRIVCADASKGKNDKPGDYSAIVFLGLGRDRLLYVDAIVDRIPLTQLVGKIVTFCEEYRPDFVGIEAEQFQELLVHEFRRQCDGRFIGRWSVFEMMTQGVSKVARIRRLTEYISGREFRFRADSPGCRKLVDQLMDFPLAEHDDGPDALEMCTRLPVLLRRLR